jgi:putative ABC transport system permease protein
MKYFVLIWAGLWRKKARTILTMLSIVVAFLLFGLLQGINQSIKGGVGNQGNARLWTISRTGAVSPMPIGLMEQIKTVKGVRAIAHISFFGGYFRDAKNPIPAFATNVESLAAVYPELNITQSMVDSMRAMRAGAVIGRPLAQRYGWKVGDKVPLGTTIWTNKDGSNSWIFDIVGIFEPTPQFARSPPGSGFWINYEYFDQARRFGDHRVHQFVIQIDDPTQSTAIASGIDRLFENSADETRTETENAALQAQLKQLVDINFIANAVVGAVLFALLFLTANTMMQSVRERMPEFAVLRTIGFSGGKVTALILVESLIPCLVAAVVGLLLSVVAMKVVGSVLGSGALPAVVVVGGLAIAVVLAIFSGLPPAIRAHRLNIVDALAGR